MQSVLDPVLFLWKSFDYDEESSRSTIVLFLTLLTKKMQRTKIKGTKFKAASSPDQEPDFYKMVCNGDFALKPCTDTP